MIRTRTQRAVAGLMAVAMVLLSACGGHDDTPVAQDTTVLVYMIGSNLESGADTPNEGGAGSLNVSEMLLAQAPANANIVIETGGAAQSYRVGPVPDWRNVRRYSVANQKLTELANLGPVDMGQPETLTDFITWAKQKYPAKKYRLVLWDHGGGWTGYGDDENSDHGFTLAQLTQSIQAAVAATNIHFDVIGFDACLMATVEVASALAPYADYLLASEENEPGPGWNWQALVQNATADAKTFGQVVADAFILKQAQAQEPADASATLSLVDLSKTGAVRSALDTLAQQLSSAVTDAQSWLVVAQSRLASTSFGGADETDIVNLAAHLSAGGVAAQAANALSEATAAAVVYKNNGRNFKDAGGLSVYFPASALDTRTPASYAAISFDAGYQTMVASFSKNGLGFPGSVSIDTTGTTNAQFMLKVTSPFGLRSLDRALLTVPQADGMAMMAGTVPIGMVPTGRASSVMAVTRTGTWMTLNGYPVVFIDKLGNGDDDKTDHRRFYNVPIEVDGVAVALRVTFDDDGNIVPLGITDGNVDTSRLQPLPDAGSEIRTLGIEYDTVHGKLGGLTPSSPVFQGGNFVFSTTTVAGTYNEGVFITSIRGDYTLSALFPRS
ncbi:clostripain-related cysteine peptidase [Caballeronia sp. LZ065]|uniref:clostripain-related cysteine peptidase n=1 Tax=Caballeronia sp. LZ065 TaxID=3038571 RepID=UPI00285958DC|nr:clostripain-related cysteine peptidase [Caballeronia sp. LZ065]MDR5781020.1 clostripain-related cysteine peptidase [Caballeronia sp. LZ065]